MTQHPLRPARALAHPAWWIALGVLAVNDHLLKGTAVLPQPVIGKLSDFAGLLVAPVLLAALLRLRRPGAVAAAHLATALGFAAINLSPAAAGAFEGLMAHTPWPWAIYVDPTDVVALPMVALSWVVFVPWMARPIALAPALGRGAAILGGWACVATSPPPEPPVVEPGPMMGNFPSASDRLMYTNETSGSVLLRVRPLRAEVALDCAAVSEDPGARLSAELFAPAVTWELAPGRALGLLQATADARPTRAGCQAWRVDGGGVAARVVFVPEGTWPATPLSTGADGVPGARRLALTELGWGEHPALFELPRAEPELPSPDCRLPPAGAGMDWTLPPGEALTLMERSASPDGCHRLLVDAQGWQEPWFLCLGGEPLPFEVGDALRVALLPEGLEVTSERARLTLLRDVRFEGSAGVTSLRALEGCAPTVDACGQWREPMEVQVFNVAEERTAWLRSGERLTLDQATIKAVRVERHIASDSACGAATETYLSGALHAVELVITEDLQE